MKTYGYEEKNNEFELNRAKKLLADLENDIKVDLMLVFIVKDNVKNFDVKQQLISSMMDRVKVSKFSEEYKKELERYNSFVSGGFIRSNEKKTVQR